MRTSVVAAAILVLAVGQAARAADYFIAPGGSDANAGTLEKPFASFKRAQEAVKPGDTVWVRGGTYAPTEGDIARKQGMFAYVNDLPKSGEKGKPIQYFAYKDEKPVFDLSAIKLPMRIDAFYVTGSWLHIKGLEVTGVQVVLTGHTQSICFANEGNNNIYEQLVMHDGQAIGIYSTRGADNLFLNCDAYRNWDYTSEGGRGGNVDGFGCHPPAGGKGNVFRGCRSWFNSDDGYDCINAHESVTFDHCWAFYNGFNAKFESKGDGNGFKGGGYGATPAAQVPNPAPRNTIQFCLAVRNKANGFYANHHTGGSNWINNTAFNNGVDFNMLERLADNKTDVDGTGHKLRNNLAYKGRTLLARYENGKNDESHDSFLMDLEISDKDFVSLDEAELVKPRKANGDLPDIGFMHLAPGSKLIDAGVDAGFPFKGKAPDLGCFEHSVEGSR
jgi:hypothetical protein